MKAQTYLFGEVEIDPEKVITFPNGLVAFENDKHFMLVHEADRGQPASFTLQSLDDPNVAFQVVDPVAVGFHYELNLSDRETAVLQNPAENDVAIMLVLFKAEESASGGIGANIRAPLILNTKVRVGIQKQIDQVSTNVTISNLASSV